MEGRKNLLAVHIFSHVQGEIDRELNKWIPGARSSYDPLSGSVAKPPEVLRF